MTGDAMTALENFDRRASRAHRAGRALSAKALAWQPGSFLKVRWFGPPFPMRSVRFSSLRLKKRWHRSRASIQDRGRQVRKLVNHDK